MKKVGKKARKTYSRLLIVGSVGFDSIMDLPGRFSDYIMADSIDQLNVSFTVETFRKEFGGTGGNCAYGLGLLKQKPVLISAWGSDADAYREHLKSVGVRLNNMVDDEKLFSATGNVMTDVDHNQMWMYYPGALKRMVDINLTDVVNKSKDLVVLMPSQPESFVKHLHEVVEFGVDYVFDPSFFVPNLTSKQIELGLAHAKIVFGNDYEIGLMEKKTNRKLDDWVKGGITIVRTLGKNGSYVFNGGNVWEIPVAKPVQSVDPTGAGDAYRAGFLTGFIKGFDLQVCGQMGALLSAYKVEKPGTQTYGFELADFGKRYEREFGEEISIG